MFYVQYVNATELCKEAGEGKEWWRFNELLSTKQQLQKLSLCLNLPKESLIKSKRGRGGFTIIHPKLLPYLIEWLEKSFNISHTEKEVKKEFLKTLKVSYFTEVACSSGFVDILTETEVIEVKIITAWKAAIGQALVYQLEFPDKKSRIHLFDNGENVDRGAIQNACNALGVLLSFHENQTQL